MLLSGYKTRKKFIEISKGRTKTYKETIEQFQKVMESIVEETISETINATLKRKATIIKPQDLQKGLEAYHRKLASGFTGDMIEKLIIDLKKEKERVEEYGK